MSEDLHIRVARVADLDALARMWEELEKYHVDLGGPEYRLARGWKEDWQRFTRQHIGRKDRPLPRGRNRWDRRRFPPWSNPRTTEVFERRLYGHIYDVFVDTAGRNRGVGEALVSAAMEWFRTRRVDRVELYTHARNELGLRFWKKMGFETTVHILDRRI